MYSWWCLGPTEYGIESTPDTEDETIDGYLMSGVEKTFTEAKRKLIVCLTGTRLAYQEAIRATRAMTKDQAGL